MTAAILTHRLAKEYRTGFWMRRSRGLLPLDLEVKRGEIFGFVGPNGAGKTTTIKILMGLHRATGGQASILGKPHTDPNSRRSVGFLPERPYFYQHLTARELLHFYGQLLDMPEPRRTPRIAALLERVDLGRFVDVPLGKYSKGMLQRVGLCQALIHEPELVVLDEPMSGLDPLGRALVRDIILEERDAGRTVFFSSHILHDVETLCDRVAILVEGKLRGVGTMGDLIGQQVAHVECTYDARTASDIPHATPIRSVDGRHRVRCAPEDADAVIDGIRAAGGSLREMHQVRVSLESLLLDEVQRAAPVDAKTAGVFT